MIVEAIDGSIGELCADQAPIARPMFSSESDPLARTASGKLIKQEIRRIVGAEGRS